MTIRPIGDRIAVRTITESDHSDSGIYLGAAPDDDGFVKKTVRGEVIAVGPGKDAAGMWGIEPGQVIEFSPVGAESFTVEGQQMTFIRRDSVVGVVGVQS